MSDLPDIQLRLGEAADVSAIQALTHRAYQPWVALIGREPRPMGADYVTAIRDHRFDLAYLDGRLAALVETKAHPDHLYIVNIAVYPELHGRGLGRRLLAHAEEIALGLGLTEMRLSTNKAFERNISLYEDIGYRIEGEEAFMGGFMVRMAKTLAAPRLLFLPGAGADPAFWRPLGDLLPATWGKHYFGWPGLGDQPADSKVNSIADLARLVETELGERPVDLIAQSMGGVVAMMVAVRHPGRVRRLVLTATSGGVDTADLTRFDWRANYRLSHPNAAEWITSERIDLTAQIPGIACPILLLWGDADPISPVAVGERLLGLLPEAKLHVVAGGDHDMAQTHAPELAPLVEAHLR